MRIISGSLKGRKLETPRGWDIRPTSDRVREALFNILGQTPKNARILDIFAGTGALGMEALSRGAVEAVFLDSSQTACQLITRNLSSMGMEDAGVVIYHTVGNFELPKKVLRMTFDLIFMDPPYGTRLLETALTDPGIIRCLAPQGLIVAEHSVKENVPETISCLDIHDQRKYGKTLITFFKPTDL